MRFLPLLFWELISLFVITHAGFFPFPFQWASGEGPLKFLCDHSNEYHDFLMVGNLLTRHCWKNWETRERNPARVCSTVCWNPKQSSSGKGCSKHPRTQTDRLVPWVSFLHPVESKGRPVHSNWPCEQWPLPVTRRLESLWGPWDHSLSDCSFKQGALEATFVDHLSSDLQ